MIQELERKLAFRIADGAEYHVTPRDVIAAMIELKEIKSPKQAHATLRKWVNKNWYDYGVALDLGWITELGKEAYSS